MHAMWDQPGNVSKLLQDKRVRSIIAQIVLNYYESFVNVWHFGFRGRLNNRSKGASLWGGGSEEYLCFSGVANVFLKAKIVFIH